MCGHDGRMWRPPAIALILSAAVAACGGGPPMAGPTVRIMSPTNGATVQSPVFVEARVDGMVVEPAGEVRPEAGHLHLMVDVACVPPGRTIPKDDQHRHLGDRSTSIRIDLPPGRHRFCLQAGDGKHGALAVSHEIEIVVESPVVEGHGLVGGGGWRG